MVRTCFVFFASSSPFSLFILFSFDLITTHSHLLLFVTSFPHSSPLLPLPLHLISSPSLFSLHTFIITFLLCFGSTFFEMLHFTILMTSCFACFSHFSKISPFKTFTFQALHPLHTFHTFHFLRPSDADTFHILRSSAFETFHLLSSSDCAIIYLLNSSNCAIFSPSDFFNSHFSTF